MSFKSPSEIRVTSRQIQAWERLPNTSIQSKPLMIYHDAFKATESGVTKQFERVGEVVPRWVYGLYNQTHFHSTTHEVYAVVGGRASLCFGGEHNPDRVEKGDIIIIPAGVAHRMLEDVGGPHEESFKMVGAYPEGNEWDICYGQEDEEDKIGGIAKVDWFHKDPLLGDDGPVLHV